MEDQNYEWFIRTAYHSGRNASIGADVDYWREFQHAHNVFIRAGSTNPSQEMYEYNRKEIQIRQFIVQALGKYQEQTLFNAGQKAELKALQTELIAAGTQKAGFGLDYLKSVMETASTIMKSSLSYTASGTGLFDDESFLKPANSKINEYRNFFGPLKQLNLMIKEAPTDASDNFERNKVEFSDDHTQCNAVIYFYPTYDENGNVVSIIQPFEFKSNITDFLLEIQTMLPKSAQGQS